MLLVANFRVLRLENWITPGLLLAWGGGRREKKFGPTRDVTVTYRNSASAQRSPYSRRDEFKHDTL